MQAATPVLALVVVVSAAGFYAYARAHKPAPSTVNGVYLNACCDSLVIRDGVISAGSSQVPFDLEDMKFGLIAFPTQRILVRAGRLEAHPDVDPGPLSFNENGTVLTFCGDPLCHQVYSFKRNGRPHKRS